MAPFFTGISKGLGGTGFGRAAAGGPVPFSATGGDVSGLAPGNGYKYHTWTGPGSLVVTGDSKTAEILLVGGGGRGGTGNSSRSGGGGGAGGLVNGDIILTAGTYTITVGAGAGGVGAPATNGGDTSITSGSTLATALGGGKGAQYDNQPAPAGGSGGGKVEFNTGTPAVGPGIQPGQPQPGLTNFVSLGNPGGLNFGDSSGGGGGATAVGGNAGPPARPSIGADGGPGGAGYQLPNFTGPLIGVPSLAPLSGYFAGGGGGGSRNVSYAPTSQRGGTGGLGGGGNGGITGGSPPPSSQQIASAGVNNSGGGGGGSGGDGGQSGQNGGDGIVVIRYLA